MKGINNSLRITAIFFLATALTGCPGVGDRRMPPETTTASATHNAICFQVPDAGDYQPSFIIISPRETPLKARTFIQQPDLTVQEGKMCIPFSFYPFPAGGQFIVDYVLVSKEKSERPRHVVVGIELTTGMVARTIPLEADEF